MTAFRAAAGPIGRLHASVARGEGSARASESGPTSTGPPPNPASRRQTQYSRKRLKRRIDSRPLDCPSSPARRPRRDGAASALRPARSILSRAIALDRGNAPGKMMRAMKSTCGNKPQSNRRRFSSPAARKLPWLQAVAHHLEISGFRRIGLRDNVVDIIALRIAAILQLPQSPRSPAIAKSLERGVRRLKADGRVIQGERPIVRAAGMAQFRAKSRTRSERGSRRRA